MSKACRFLFIISILALPIMFISSSVTWALNDINLYQRGFEKYRVSEVTGIPVEELTLISKEIRSYFNSNMGTLQPQTTAFGREIDLFNHTEILHMQDVKGLVRGVYWLLITTALYLLLLIVIGLSIWRSAMIVPLAKSMLWGSCLTIALVALISIFSLVDFDRMFLMFHRSSFANNYWMLNPYEDYLVMLFPTGFWFDATIFVALLTIGQSTLLGGIGSTILLFRNHRRRQQHAK